ncbi:branched-chain amino acid ABC transporter permease [Pseudonocardia pini]|uniref:branched-chain amino acid ABC transporter permease n=1 Tax=Pseudonocardia pini TaxID=2758030 RepID=UPI0015F018AB|nr:branched-chain amino acid ABC transporter permease [Pseudonocardia pini]
MDLLIARIVDGLNNGVIYGFLALALVCVYRGTKHLNLAQGEMAMFSAFIAYALYAVGLPVPVAVLGTVLVGFLAGGLVERVLIRPLGHHADYSILLVTIGLFLVLNAGAGVIWGGDPLPFPALVPSSPEDYIAFFGTRLRYQPLLVLGVLIVVMTALFVLFKYTRLGLAMRATASNPESARLLGIRVNRINSLGWMLAAGVGALVGALIAPSTTLTTGMMFNFLIYAAAAATLGGFDSPGGAVLAGILLGIAENIIGSYVWFVGTDLKQAVALVILLAVLMIRPTGMFGTKKVERV